MFRKAFPRRYLTPQKERNIEKYPGRKSLEKIPWHSIGVKFHWKHGELYNAFYVSIVKSLHGKSVEKAWVSIGVMEFLGRQCKAWNNYYMEKACRKHG